MTDYVNEGLVKEWKYLQERIGELSAIISAKYTKEGETLEGISVYDETHLLVTIDDPERFHTYDVTIGESW